MIRTRSETAKSHRDRKNGASREEWVARKAARNAERPLQAYRELNDGKVERVRE
jgi:hypothetical protein